MPVSITSQLHIQFLLRKPRSSQEIHYAISRKPQEIYQAEYKLVIQVEGKSLTQTTETNDELNKGDFRT